MLDDSAFSHFERARGGLVCACIFSLAKLRPPTILCACVAHMCLCGAHVPVWHLQWSTVGRVLAHGHQLVFGANASGISRMYDSKANGLMRLLGTQPQPSLLHGCVP